MAVSSCVGRGGSLARSCRDTQAGSTLTRLPRLKAWLKAGVADLSHFMGEVLKQTYDLVDRRA
jgi:hypothetical protein